MLQRVYSKYGTVGLKPVLDQNSRAGASPGIQAKQSQLAEHVIAEQKSEGKLFYE